MSLKPFLSRGLATVTLVALGCAPAIGGENALYTFHGGSSGSGPNGALIGDTAKNLYGTTASGGISCQDGQGCGTVFRLAQDGKETVLYAFRGGNDGAHPQAALISDSAGNFYGTTLEGGGCSFNGDCGTVFELSADGTESVLHAFQGSDGLNPRGNLIADASGNLYGTTIEGGNLAACGGAGCGTVFELQPNGMETTLYAFQGGSDGASPQAGLIEDSTGNFYGTTVGGGIFTCVNGSIGCGVVFKLAPDGTETVLHAFQGGSDGDLPRSGLIADKIGNLYGTTTAGGPNGYGTVFELTPDGTETVLYSFKAGNDGNFPIGGVNMDKTGNLYGTTTYGGGPHCKGEGCGTVFKLAPDGTETVLFAFFGKHGVQPDASLLMGKDGLLYGTASAGGKYNDGVVFSVKK
jgi:uncharacterized repeat protein (TIGR03803 family)